MPNQSDWVYDAEEHLRQQLLRDAARPLEEKLRWLEEAHHTVLELEKQNKAKQSPQNTEENR
jgi:hypothetical protein